MALKYTKMERNWVMYDVGNSALVLLNTAVVPIYFNAINTGAISDETTRYDEMAARLTSNLEEEAGESTAHTGLLDKFRLGGFHLGGKADDESADSAAQPFDTAEIPVSRRRDFESAEDAPEIGRAHV